MLLYNGDSTTVFRERKEWEWGGKERWGGGGGQEITDVSTKRVGEISESVSRRESYHF